MHQSLCDRQWLGPARYQFASILLPTYPEPGQPFRRRDGDEVRQVPHSGRRRSSMGMSAELLAARREFLTVEV
jgi:hypothetical protein